MFLVAYSPPFASHRYFPSIGEIAVTVGLAAGLILAYRSLVMVFPVLPPDDLTTAGANAAGAAGGRGGS